MLRDDGNKKEQDMNLFGERYEKKKKQPVRPTRDHDQCVKRIQATFPGTTVTA